MSPDVCCHNSLCHHAHSSHVRHPYHLTHQHQDDHHLIQFKGSTPLQPCQFWSHHWPCHRGLPYPYLTSERCMNLEQQVCPTVYENLFDLIVISSIPGGYVKPSLPNSLWEISDTAEKGPLPPQLLPSPPVVTHALTSNGNTAIPHITLATSDSKPISNRALVLAALSNGTIKLKNLLHSDDTQVMMAALQALNVHRHISHPSSADSPIGSHIQVG